MPLHLLGLSAGIDDQDGDFEEPIKSSTLFRDQTALRALGAINNYLLLVTKNVPTYVEYVEALKKLRVYRVNIISSLRSHPELMRSLHELKVCGNNKVEDIIDNLILASTRCSDNTEQFQTSVMQLW